MTENNTTDEKDVEEITFAEGEHTGAYDPPHHPGGFETSYSIGCFFEAPASPRVSIDLAGEWGELTFFLTADEGRELAAAIVDAVEAGESAIPDNGMSGLIGP